ncbi:MAG: hypothetical protein V3U88_10825 [Methylococcales bacterium]
MTFAGQIEWHGIDGDGDDRKFSAHNNTLALALAEVIHIKTHTQGLSHHRLSFLPARNDTCFLSYFTPKW